MRDAGTRAAAVVGAEAVLLAFGSALVNVGLENAMSPHALADLLRKFADELEANAAAIALQEHQWP